MEKLKTLFVTKNIIMKYLILTLLVLATGIPAFAQVTDIKNLVDKTPQELASLYDNSVIITDSWVYGEEMAVELDSCVFAYNDINAHRMADVQFVHFTTTNMCVLSDYIEGGIKVGDSLSRLQSIDFVHTPYGRGRQGNKLHLTYTYGNEIFYEAYSNENASFTFIVTDGIISKINYDCLQDCDPNNINPYSPFGN